MKTKVKILCPYCGLDSIVSTSSLGDMYTCKHCGNSFYKQGDLCIKMPDIDVDKCLNDNIYDNDLISRRYLINKINESMNHNPHTDSKISRNHIMEHRHFLQLLSEAPTATSSNKIVYAINDLISSFEINILKILKEGGIINYDTTSESSKS